MGKTAILAIRIIGDSVDAVAAMTQVDSATGSMSATMDKASVGATIALGAITAAAVACGNAASELQQAEGAVDSVFGAYSDRIHANAERASGDVGLAASEYSNLSAILGAQLKNMGMDMDETTNKTGDLITMGADLAATFGGTTSDAVGAISSLLRGERDPIERYGVSLKQVDIDARIAALGLDGLTGEAEKSANTQATLSLLLEQTSSAAGQFGREADTAAGQQQRANAAFEDAKASLGEQLLPIMAEGALMLADLAHWAGENSELVTTMALVIGGLAGAILIANGVMKAWSVAQGIATAAQWAFNAAQLANPVGLVIAAIVLAIGVLIAITLLIIQNWDEVSRVAGEVWTNVLNFMAPVTDTLSSIVDWLDRVGDAMGSLFSGGGFDKLGEVFGGDFSARMIQEPAPVASPSVSRMMFSAEEAMAGFSSMPALSARSSSFVAPSDLGSAASPSNTAGPTFNLDLTINGAIDKDGTARALIAVLEEHFRGSGGIAAGGTSWR